MVGVAVTFNYDGDFDRARVLAVAQNARGMFEGMAGLRFKFFTFDQKQQRATNFYVWESQETAEHFFSDELRERVTELTVSHRRLSSSKSPRSWTTQASNEEIAGSFLMARWSGSGERRRRGW